jgi:hypothetical protein
MQVFSKQMGNLYIGTKSMTDPVRKGNVYTQKLDDLDLLQHIRSSI